MKAHYAMLAATSKTKAKQITLAREKSPASQSHPSGRSLRDRDALVPDYSFGNNIKVSFPAIKFPQRSALDWAVDSPSLPGTPGSAVTVLPEGSYWNIKRIKLGNALIETWYQAPYPEEFANVPDGTLWLCEFCLKYTKTEWQLNRHRVGAFISISLTTAKN